MKSVCCGAPVLSVVEPLKGQFCNVVSEGATTLIYKCMGCGQRCEVKEDENEE